MSTPMTCPEPVIRSSEQTLTRWSLLPVARPEYLLCCPAYYLGANTAPAGSERPTDAQHVPGAYYRVYQAMNVQDIDGILKVQTNQMPKDPASENIDAVDGKQLQALLVSSTTLTSHHT